MKRVRSTSVNPNDESFSSRFESTTPGSRNEMSPPVVGKNRHPTQSLVKGKNRLYVYFLLTVLVQSSQQLIPKPCFNRAKAIVNVFDSTQLRIGNAICMNEKSCDDEDRMEKGISRSEDIQESQFESEASDRANDFHTDMRRVLESRAKLASETFTKPSLQNATSYPAHGASDPTLERRSRPQLLTSDIDGAERVQTMLKHMIEIGVATEESYQIVLKAFCDRGRLRWRRSDNEVICAADEVSAFIDEMWLQQSSDVEGRFKVSAETCNMVLQIYAVCSTPRGDRCYAQKAQELVERMEKSGIPVGVESLSHVIHAWAWQQANMEPGDCARKAKETLNKMIALSPDVKMLLQCYDWVLEAESKSGSDGSEQSAEKLFQEMKRLSAKKSDSDCFLLPNAQSYANVVLAWSKCKSNKAAQKAHSLLVELIERFTKGGFPDGSEPVLIAFNGVVVAWARVGRPDKAEEVLWMLNDVRTRCKNLVPDVLTYNSVLHAHVRSSDKKKALNKILGVVKHMEEESKAQPHIKPDSFTYNTVMKAWIQSGEPDSAEQAEKILQKMEQLWKEGDKAQQPTNRHYNVVINALAKSSNHRLAARKAYELLQRMQGTRTCKPDIITYTSVIECFSKSSDPQAAEIAQELLQQAADLYEETKNPRLMPNARTFSMVILALSKSPTPANVATAHKLLTRLVELYEETNDPSLRPSEYPYNYALNCAANCLGTPSEKGDAFQIAAGIYKEMTKSALVRPDSYTYTFWIKCCNNLLSDGEVRTKCVTYAFNQCRTEGLVTAEVLNRLLAGSPNHILESLLNISPKTPPAIYRQMTIEDVPLDWSRNVR